MDLMNSEGGKLRNRLPNVKESSKQQESTGKSMEMD